MANPKPESTQVARLDYQTAFDEALTDLLNPAELDDIFDAAARMACAKNEMPPPKDRLGLDKWRAFVENATPQERKAWAIDSANFAKWLANTETATEPGDTGDLVLPGGLVQLNELILYLEGQVEADSDGYFLPPKDDQDTRPFMVLAIASKNGKPSLIEAIVVAMAIWVLHRENYGGKHPLAASAEAWQKAATAVPITKAVDVSYPVALRLPFGAVSAQEIEAEKDYHLPVFEPFDAQMLLDLGDERTNQLARHLPIRSWLMDWNTGGKAKGGHGGRVPVWLRLFLEALVCSDPSRFWGNRVVFYELEYLYKLIYGDTARWDKVRVRQLRRMIDIASRAVVVLRDGGEVLPVNFKYFEGLERDSKIFVEVAAVRDARGGALTAIEDLRAAYRSSNATLQAYLSASEYLDRVWTRNGRLLYETVPVKNADSVILDHLGDPIMTKNGKPLKAVEGADKEKEDKKKEDKEEGKPLRNLKNADKEIVELVMREPNPRFTPLPVANDELVGVCWVDNSIPISQRREYKKRALETWDDLTIIDLEEVDQDSSFIRPSQKHRNTYRAVKKASEQAKNQ